MTDPLKLLMGVLDPLAQAGTKLPNPRPAEFLKLSDGGGDFSEGRLAANTLTVVEAWATSEADARRLAQAAVERIQVWAETQPDLDHVEVTWPVSYPDAESNTPRYTFSVWGYHTS